MMGARVSFRSAARLTLTSLVFAGVVALRAEAQPPPTSPDDFVAAAAGSDQYEIMAARVALTESKDARLRAFAEAMIRDHTSAGATLRGAAARSSLKPPPTTVGGDQVAFLAALQGLRGADFDRAYARQQVLAHRQALATMHGYAQEGSDPNLRGVAKANTPMIEHHLETAQALQRSIRG